VTLSDGPVEYGGIPPAESTVGERLVRVLFESQQPDLAGLPPRDPVLAGIGRTTLERVCG
jgi:hypothetical protein